jgi:hypothetical protein
MKYKLKGIKYDQVEILSADFSYPTDKVGFTPFGGRNLMPKKLESLKKNFLLFIIFMFNDFAEIPKFKEP